MYQVLPQFISSLLEYFTLWPSSSWLWSPPSSCSAQLVAWRRDNGTDRAYSAVHHRIPSLQWLVKAQAGNIIFVTINLLHHHQRHHRQSKRTPLVQNVKATVFLGFLHSGTQLLFQVVFFFCLMIWKRFSTLVLPFPRLHFCSSIGMSLVTSSSNMAPWKVHSVSVFSYVLAKDFSYINTNT